MRSIQKKAKRKKYLKPRLSQKKIAVNFFYNSSGRYLDSFNSLLDIGVYAQSGGCSGACSSAKADICFLPDTMITLANGSKKRIDQLVNGEKILTYDVKLKKHGQGVVSDIEHHWRRDGYFKINQQLQVTGDHPLWINGQTWKKVKDISKSDSVQSESGEQLKVTTIIKIEEEVVVYNIQIQGESSTYYANGILANSYSLPKEH